LREDAAQNLADQPQAASLKTLSPTAKSGSTLPGPAYRDLTEK